MKALIKIRPPAGEPFAKFGCMFLVFAVVFGLVTILGSWWSNRDTASLALTILLVLTGLGVAAIAFASSRMKSNPSEEYLNRAGQLFRFKGRLQTEL